MSIERTLLLVVLIKDSTPRLICTNINISNIPNRIWKGAYKREGIENYGVDYGLIEPYLSEDDKETIKQIISQVKKEE